MIVSPVGSPITTVDCVMRLPLFRDEVIGLGAFARGAVTSQWVHHVGAGTAARAPVQQRVCRESPVKGDKMP